MSRTFFVVRRFHMGYSILGRRIKHRIEDEHYAEGIFIIAFAALFIVMVLSNFLGWALLHLSSSGSSVEQLEFYYWIGQSTFALLFFMFCMLGFKPALKVSFDSNMGLSIEQGSISTHLSLQNVHSVTIISALRFHQHHRKYRTTRSFFVRLPPSLILISTDDGPVALGLSQSDQQELLKLLQPQLEKIVFPTLSPIV